MSDVSVPISPLQPTTPVDREQFWRATVAAFPSSGLSVRAFCADRGVSE